MRTRPAIQIIIPLHGDSHEEEMANREDESADFGEPSNDRLQSIVMEAVGKLGDFLDETGYTRPFGSVFSGSKSVGIVEIDENDRVVPKKKSPRPARRGKRK